MTDPAEIDPFAGPVFDAIEAALEHEGQTMYAGTLTRILNHLELAGFGVFPLADPAPVGLTEQDDWCLECEHAPHGVGPRACKTCGCGAQRCEQCGVRKSYDGLAWACAEGCPDA